ncbi:MAG: DUF1289 domain-containing protein [Gammaproteobacteria bacterium]|nr:DUF1289 domain-containing protein [Gammaproteobacteria bacterium]
MATSDTDINPVESPCINICTLDDDDICVGCFRSIDEICAWREASESERRAVLERAAARGNDIRRA